MPSYEHNRWFSKMDVRDTHVVLVECLFNERDTASVDRFTVGQEARLQGSGHTRQALQPTHTQHDVLRQNQIIIINHSSKSAREFNHYLIMYVSN